jgi:hypothetical protein
MKFRGRNAQPNRPRKAMVCPTCSKKSTNAGQNDAPYTASLRCDKLNQLPELSLNKASMP